MYLIRILLVDIVAVPVMGVVLVPMQLGSDIDGEADMQVHFRMDSDNLFDQTVDIVETVCSRKGGDFVRGGAI